MKSPRDYNRESRDTSAGKYSYRFDVEIMHPLMLRAFQPFFRKGSALELGSFRGDFTRHLLPNFEKVTCVEASGEALEFARTQFGSRVDFVQATFENLSLQSTYDNVILTHVLEHVDDRVGLLRRINKEWLSRDGRLFVACPNANAPSRQIAVKMRLIEQTTAVSPSEREHGHRVTYSMETLARDAEAGGLSIVHRSGIFFKALANFQWDRLLETDIISPEYLEGCYQIGLNYPELCSSIFLVCEKGK